MTEEERRIAEDDARCKLAFFLGALIGNRNGVPPDDVALLSVEGVDGMKFEVTFRDLMLLSGVNYQ